MKSELETSVVAAAAQSQDGVERVAVAIELRRPAEGPRGEAPSGMTTLAELRRAIELIERADPEQLRLVRSAMAAEGVPFYQDARTFQREPSAAGFDPRNEHIIAAAAASHQAAVERDRVASEQQAPSRAAAIEHLSAGQTPANSAAIRRQGRVP